MNKTYWSPQLQGSDIDITHLQATAQRFLDSQNLELLLHVSSSHIDESPLGCSSSV